MRVFCTKLFGRVVQSESTVSRSSFFRKKLVAIFINFFIFGLWAGTSQTLDKKNNDWVAETALYGFRDFLVIKTFSPEKTFPMCFWLWANDFRASGQNFGRLTKTALYVSRGDFRRKKFPIKIVFLTISLWSWADDFQDSGENCRKYYQSGILLVQTNILPKKCFGEKDLNTCGFSGEILKTSAGKCLEESSEGTNFAKKGNSNHLLTLGEKASNFSPKVPSGAVRTALYVSKGRILGKKFWKYTVLWSSRTPRKTFWTLCEKFFAGLPVMHFTRPNGVFGRNFWLKSAPHIHGFQTIIGAGLMHKTFR